MARGCGERAERSRGIGGRFKTYIYQGERSGWGGHNRFYPPRASRRERNDLPRVCERIYIQCIRPAAAVLEGGRARRTCIYNARLTGN